MRNSYAGTMLGVKIRRGTGGSTLRNLTDTDFETAARSGPLVLDAGTHTLHVTYAGSEPLRRVAVDGFLIQPVIAQRVFAGPDGAQLVLTCNTQTGVYTLDED